MRLSFEVRMSPGVPPPRAVDQLADLLVVEAPFFEVTHILRGSEIDAHNAGRTLNLLFESGQQVVQLAGDDEQSFFDILMTKSPRYASRIAGSVENTNVEGVQQVIDRLFDIATVHIALIEGRTDLPERVRARTRAAMDAVKERKDGPVGSHWRRFVLSGLAHRTMLSDELVEFLGPESVASLPPDLAWRESGRQIIAGTEDPIPLPPDRYDPQEKAILDALEATDAFFNPETGEPPTRLPELQNRGPVRFWGDQGLTEWQDQ